MPPHFHTIGYADDLAVVVIALNKQGNTVLQEVNSWLDYHKLRLAWEKTEVIVMAGRKIPIRDLFHNRKYSNLTSRKLKISQSVVG